MKKILVTGAGAMGSGIAYLVARYLTAAEVYLCDPSKEQLERAVENFRKWDIKDSLKENCEPKKIADNVKYLTSVRELPDSSIDLMIEAASENLEIKKKIFIEYDRLASAEALISSNTSSLPLTQLAQLISINKRPNVLGLHFFNPPRVMQLIEIITTPDTSAVALQRARELATQLGKTSVVCKDSPGFITSRLGIVLLNEAIFALQEGLATAEEIDTAIKLGYNHPMGPLKLADFIGLDVVFAVTQTLYENFQDPKYRPSILLRKMVEAGHLGRKTGRGFFTYDKSE